MEKISEVLIESTGQTVKLEGEKGTTFTPSVDANGNLSWTNDGGKQNPTTVNIKGERGEKGDTTVIDPSTATVYTLYNQKGNHTDGAMTQAAVTEEFEKLDENYARNDGYYESMGVGTASNLKGQNVVDAEFAYRKSGGNVEVQDGNAMIEAIKGNTIAWNQLVTPQKINSVRPYSSNVTNVSVDNGVVTTTCVGTTTAPYERGFIVPNVVEPPIIGHKYLISMQIKASVDRIYSLSDFGSGRAIPTQRPSSFVANTWQYYCGIATVETTSISGSKNLLIRVENQQDIGEAFYSKELIFFDLTLIYGLGNEPTSASQFEQDYFNWFGKPLTYEPYDAGSLHNTKVSGIKTVGFNLWDEEWVNGYVQKETGNVIEIGGNTIASKNLIPVVHDATYYFRGIGYITLYDANQAAVGQVSKNNDTFDIGTNVRYIRFHIDGYGRTYNHDICINISDVNRNGEYEPYKESTLPLDVTTLTGKLNGEGSSVVVFADGMNSVGDVHDEIKIGNGVVKAIKRVGKVDLVTLNWWFSTTRGSLWFVGLPNLKQISSSYITPNVITSIYSTTSYYTKPDKSISQYYHTNELCIYDSSYVSSDTPIQPHLQGVMLYYELEEPEVYVLDDFNLPKLYPVANGGTEEQLSNSPNSLPATLSIRYGLNAAAFIQNAPKNYISKESMNNFLGNLGSAMGGTWSMVWNSSTNKYDFSFTQNRSVDVKQPIEDK